MLDRKFLDDLARSSDTDINTDMDIEIFSMRNCATANTTNGTMLRSRPDHETLSNDELSFANAAPSTTESILIRLFRPIGESNRVREFTLEIWVDSASIFRYTETDFQ
ncbi:hypothetical protein HZH68_003910 [Vespula germanica]|uniref:Uncharacterized protein n=1 Tax=Vespula germanica TaxID=30212 RepID=A0A836V0M5_VESGE|nr:hypothetical protein HZH68_003910 [Vespula germanica]